MNRMVKHTYYWRKFSENYPLVIGHSLALIMSFFVLVAWFNFMTEIIQSIDEPYGQVLATIVLIFALVKIMTWIGTDLLNSWGNKMHEAFTR